MEENKIRIAITHGDTNGVGYETIFKVFAEPAILELCTPIIYGSPKVAAYHRKSLDMQVNFAIISRAEDARDNRLNLLTCFEKEVKSSHPRRGQAIPRRRKRDPTGGPPPGRHQRART